VSGLGGSVLRVVPEDVQAVVAVARGDVLDATVLGSTWTPHRAAAGVARVELGQLAVGVRVVGEQRM
jgi:hypothetical protein